MNIKQLLEYDGDLYIIKFNDYVSFTFRLLSLREFSLLSSLMKNGMHPYFVYEEAFNLGSIEDLKYLNLSIPAGYIISTGNLILTMSGANEGKDFLYSIAETRKEKPFDSLLEHIKTTIYYAFKTLTPLEINKLTEKQLINLFVEAENYLRKTKENFQPLDLQKIYDEMYNEKPVNKPQRIHVNENEFLERELDPYDLQQAENEMYNEHKQKLSKELLRELDNRRK